VIEIGSVRLPPGARVVYLDPRGWDEARDEWEQELREAFLAQGQDNWDFRWEPLSAGNTALYVVGEDAPRDADGLAPATLVAITVEKWTVSQFLASAQDGRFFGENSEIKQITAACPKDGQALLAYVEEDEVRDPATGMLAWKEINQGIIDSLCRDYDVRTYQIRLDRVFRYAHKIATYARRAFKEPSPKAAFRSPKRTSTARQQEHLLAYLFRPAIVPALLEQFGAPGNVILALRALAWTPTGHLVTPHPFAGIPSCGEKTLARAYALAWQDVE